MIKMDDLSIDIFKKADTIGIFQFESSGMINFLSKLIIIILMIKKTRDGQPKECSVMLKYFLTQSIML